MSKFIGRKISIGIGKETTRGTLANPDFWLPCDFIDFDDEIEVGNYGERYQSLHGFGSLNYVVGKRAEGSLGGEVDADSVGLLMLAVFGTVNTAGPTDSAYTHTFTLDPTNVHDSLTITELKPAITAKRFPLGMIKKLSINADAGEIVKYTARFVSRSGI